MFQFHLHGHRVELTLRTRHVFVKHRCPGGNKVKMWQNLQFLQFDPARPQGTWYVSEA